MSQIRKKPYQRSLRASKVLVEILAEALERMKDGEERLENLTITGAEISKDFKSAKIYFDSLPTQAVEALEEKRPYLQRLVGTQVRWKYIPSLVFLDDPAIKAAIAIESALKRIKLASGEPNIK